LVHEKFSDVGELIIVTIKRRVTRIALGCG
jgi:hypothetical protein